MNITVLTLFPEMFRGVLEASIVKRAQEKEAVSIHCINIRDFSVDTYKTVDDHPYGGGAGMILRVDVIDRAICAAKSRFPSIPSTVVLLDPQGIPYTQKIARRLSVTQHIILVCAHYEGIDERIRVLCDLELSIGDYIVTGGEIPAMIIIDSVTRLLPGVLKKEEATVHESFEQSLLEYPQYTRPETYNGVQVPDILRSGNHKAISDWRNQEALKRTKLRRPDLIQKDQG